MKTIYLNSEPITPDTAVGDSQSAVGDLQSPTDTQHPIVATVGFFDGVHRGHQFLIDHVRSMAKSLDALSMIVTFDRHPRHVLHGESQPRLLTTLDEKLLLLSKTGIDAVVVVPFDADMAAMTAREFMQTVLKQRCGISHLVLGYDNRFGSGRTATPEDCAAYGREAGIAVSTIGSLEAQGEHISSSAVRRYLEKGNVEAAQQCLGHPYVITGTVVEGDREGRKMGIPTANILPDDSLKMVPARGVYAVKVMLPNSVEMKHGVMNIGMRPTFGSHPCTLETHIMQYDDDLYGQTLRIAFAHRIREEIPFDTPEQLSEQIHADMTAATALFEKDNEDED